MSQQPANWYPDPDGGGGLRYWDGTQWTENRAPGAQPVVVTTKKKRGCLPILGILALVVVVIIVIAAIGASNSSSKPDSNIGTTPSTGPSKGITAKGSTDPIHEVKITACTKDALGDVEIKGTAVNDTSKRSDFIISLAITDASGKTQLGTSSAIAQNVEPGQTALWDAPTTATWHAGVVCRVLTVDRTASL